MAAARPTGTRLAGIVFTALFGALAITHATTSQITIDNTLIALIVLALLPWSLSWIAPFLKTLKIAGMELEFKQLEQEVAQAKADLAATATALASGVGRRAEPGEAGNVIDPSDPNKGRFGGAPERDGLKLSGTARRVGDSADVFTVVVWLTSTDPSRALPDGTEVLFVLHPTFSPAVVPVRAQNGSATLTRLALGGFTVGAEVRGTKLELDLAVLPGVPAEFAAR